MDTVDTVCAWASAHPEFMAVIAWPLISAIMSLLFKPRTPEEFDAMGPRMASFFRLVSALGVDPVKATEAAKGMLTSKKDDK